MPQAVLPSRLSPRRLGLRVQVTEPAYSQGGLIPGPGVTMRMVPESRPEVGSDRHVIYSDECFISGDGACVRSDEAHCSATIPSDRFWICPAHD